MKNIVITFSGKAGAGKDTCTEFTKKHFEEKGLKVFCLAYADYLKVLCKRNFGYDDADKEHQRDILQHFGTDVVREIDDIFWVETVFNTIDVLREVYDVFLISDARYENELRPHPWTLGYAVFNTLVRRKEENSLTEAQREHSSEMLAEEEDTSKFHFLIDNNDSIEALDGICKELVDFIMKIKKQAEENANLEDIAGGDK